MKTTSYSQPMGLMNGGIPPQADESGLDLGQVLGALRRRAILVIGITAAVMVAAGLKGSLDVPSYQAQFELLIQPNTAESDVISSLPEALTGRQSQAQGVTPDLLKILGSPKILLPVVKRFKMQYPDACEQFGASTSSIPLGESPNDSCYKFITSNLRVEVVGKDSNIIQVTYQGLKPQQVKSLLDLTAKAYLDYSLQSRQLAIRKGIEFVEGKLPDLQQQVQSLQGELQALRQGNDIIDPEAKGSQLSGQVGDFKQQQLETQVQLEQAAALSGDLQGQLAGRSPEVAASSALSENPRYQSLLNRMIELDGKIAEATTVYTEETPDLQVLREERNNLVSLLERESQQVQREVAGKIRELQVRDRSLTAKLGSLNSEVRQLAGVSRSFTDVQRELQIATEALNQLLAKRQAQEIDIAQREIPWELITPTTSPQPFDSSMARNLALGAILGLLLGTGAALAMNRLADVIYTPEELKRLIKLPLLGIIPYNDTLSHAAPIINLAPVLQTVGASTLREFNGGKHNGKVRRHYYEADPFAESFRSLYANIRLLNTDVPVQSLVISSAMPGEGKSTISVYLAQAAAAMGQRVLLVDTDLRCPRVHEYVGLPNKGGLIDVLAGQMDLKGAIQRSLVEPNLFVLTAGAVPPDPTRLLSSQRMHHLMMQVNNNFDLVIYDAPPLLGFADAHLMATHTHGVMLVSQLGRLKRSLAEQALEQLRVSSIPVLGMVIQSHEVS
ncbi:MAG: polysaccharide biosynthesis tyrosine autokinase [Timaviella obliquedivisa GSE-PSE-MK23-08B]|jgi:capsular exopolysaccharide synthesis family protein|nr:polysaccharide biosynthesis tyrosine autokinase [Timaviella obliquedivisa GSE-PSE-MK23-08B]